MKTGGPGLRSDLRTTAINMVPSHYRFATMTQGEVVELVKMLKTKHAYKYEEPETVSTVHFPAGDTNPFIAV